MKHFLKLQNNIIIIIIEHIRIILVPKLKTKNWKKFEEFGQKGIKI